MGQRTKEGKKSIDFREPGVFSQEEPDSWEVDNAGLELIRFLILLGLLAMSEDLDLATLRDVTRRSPNTTVLYRC